MDKLSIIVPCYNEEESIRLFYDEVEKQVLPVEKEYIFINDGSRDNTLNELRKLAKEDSRVRYESFTRNFGKEAGLYAGLVKATGNLVVVMDVDLQDPPEILAEMVTTLTSSNEYDCVGTRRTTRDGEPVIRSFFAKGFYKLINKISDTEIVDGARDYRMMSRQMVDSILMLTENNRFSKGIFSWVGYKTKYLEYKNVERVAGTTSWNFWGLFKYSLDGIVDFSEAPLNVASLFGIFSCILAFLMAIFLGVRTIIFGDPTSGWTSLIVVILAIGGIQLFCMGIIGKYVGKIYKEAKNRPVYLVKEDELSNPLN